VPTKFALSRRAVARHRRARGAAGRGARGSFIAKNVVLMPSYVNIGAYVDEGTMVDTWATVGSCAQIGKNVHLSGGVGIGGVLEPLQANPTIIEDNCFIGARSEVVEGVIVEENSVLSMGVYIGQSTKIYDRETGEISYGRVPSGRVVVRATCPSARRQVQPVLRRDRQEGGRADARQDQHQRAAARLIGPPPKRLRPRGTGPARGGPWQILHHRETGWSGNMERSSPDGGEERLGRVHVGQHADPHQDQRPDPAAVGPAADAAPDAQAAGRVADAPAAWKSWTTPASSTWASASPRRQLPPVGLQAARLDRRGVPLHPAGHPGARLARRAAGAVAAGDGKARPDPDGGRHRHRQEHHAGVDARMAQPAAHRATS
jgi:carbonic anhydrase/acetyltransferase-like protein (isoleucine patch superfamily)